MLENVGVLLKNFFTNTDLTTIRILIFLLLSLILTSGVSLTNVFKENKKLGKLTAVLISLIAVLGMSDKTVSLILTSYSFLTIFLFLILPIIAILIFAFTYKGNDAFSSFIKTLIFGFTAAILNYSYNILEQYNFYSQNISFYDIVDIILLVVLILFFYYLFDFITKIFIKDEKNN